MRRSMKSLIPALAAILLAAGCSSTPDDTIGRPVEELYTEALDSMQAGNVLKAENYYNRIMSRYPFTEYATQAHLDILYVYLQMNEPESLVEEADRFVRENPRHQHIDYVYYMRAMAYFPMTPNPIESLAGVDLARRDISNAEKSFGFFTQLIARFPDSKYAADARLRMMDLKQRIARHEIYVADYYLRREAWISALRRAQRVVTDFGDTPAVIDGLIALERSYTELDLPELAETPRRILDQNPDREPVLLRRD